MRAGLNGLFLQHARNDLLAQTSSVRMLRERTYASGLPQALSLAHRVEIPPSTRKSAGGGASACVLPSHVSLSQGVLNTQ